MGKELYPSAHNKTHKHIMQKRSVSRDAYSSMRVLVGFILTSLGAFLAIFAFGLYPGASVLAAKSGSQQPQLWQPKWVVVHSSQNDISAPLRDMATWDLVPLKAEHEANENPPIGIMRARDSKPDTAVQRRLREKSLVHSIRPGLKFDGVPFPGVVCNCAPPIRTVRSGKRNTSR